MQYFPKQWQEVLSLLLTHPAVIGAGARGESQPEATSHFQTPAMTETESKHLRHLLTAFDARALGEGDKTTGINLLAAMAITLANLACPGSGIRTPDGRLIPVGCNLLAAGARTTNMVLNDVVMPVGRCQNNLLGQLDRLLKNDKAEEERALRNLARRWILSKSQTANTGENALLQLMIDDGELGPMIETREDQWTAVVGSAPSEHFGDLVRRPRAFIAAPTAALLNQQLAGVHRGQALVTIGLSRAADAAKFGKLCPALMDGLMPAGPFGDTVRGRLLVTVPASELSKAATAGGDETAWLGRLLWLVDGGHGPELMPQQGGDGKIVRLPNLTARFEYAVQRIFAKRLNSQNPEPVIDDSDFAPLQARWMSFLADMERNVPDISGMARSLFASLLFGLGRLVGAEKTPEGFIYYMAGIEGLARHVIRRMANARSAILFSSEEEWKLRYKQRILAKLAEGPQDTRFLYRLFHLPASVCENLLAEIEADNRVKRCGRQWERVEGATLPGDQSHRFRN